MKFAIKRLRHTDLTFFKSYFKKTTGGKQKAINLDAAVFADTFFPKLSKSNPDRPTSVFFDLTIVGPNSAPPFILARKALIQQKNWRLNGEFVDDDDNPNRFDLLAPDDLAVLAFDGSDEPIGVAMAVFAAGSHLDQPAFAALATLVGNSSMVSTDIDALNVAFQGLAADHSARLILPDAELAEDLADAAVGSTTATDAIVKKVAKGKVLKKITPADLEAAWHLQRKIGSDGEDLIAEMFENMVIGGAIKSYEHTSQLNPVSPYDFTVVGNDGATCVVEAKSTTGAFNRAFHISSAEVRAAAQSEVPYLVFRLFDLKSNHAKVRRSNDIRDFAKGLLKQPLPVGVSVDCYSVSPDCLSWGPVEQL